MGAHRLANVLHMRRADGLCIKASNHYKARREASTRDTRFQTWQIAHAPRSCAAGYARRPDPRYALRKVRSAQVRSSDVGMKVTDVVVRWLDGVREAFGSFPADGIHILRRGNGLPADSAGEPPP